MKTLAERVASDARASSRSRSHPGASASACVAQQGVSPTGAAPPRSATACACGGGCPSCRGAETIQARLNVGAAHDRYEQEADQVASQVMRAAAPGALRITPVAPGSHAPATNTHGEHEVQRRGEPQHDKPHDEEDEEQNEPTRVQTKRAAGDAPDDGRGIESALDASRGGGQPLSAPTRAFFEARFGHGFSEVRVHADGQAQQLARSLNAQAFTAGRDIYFNTGRYQPEHAGGRELLAHELTHTVQQAGGQSTVQRACDPGVVATRTDPVFFPRERINLEVFNGTRTLRQWTSHRAAVGLIQQALVDLGYDLGPYGPRIDGVDQIFGPVTEQGIRDFQTDESVSTPNPGDVDQITLRCLDEVRSKRVVPAHQAGAVTPEQYQINEARSGGRDEDIFFDRGSSTLNAEGELKVGRLASRFSCWPVTLEGYISEDERVDEGPGLATDRIGEVDFWLMLEGHDSGCPPPPPGLRRRIPSPQPEASAGVSDYRGRRKVEVVPAGRSSTTVACPPGSPRHRPLNPVTESPVLTAAIQQAIDWLDVAIPKLAAGNIEGDAALAAYFGGTSRRTQVRNNLGIWRNHLNTVIRVNNRHGTQCLSTCETAIAFNSGLGASAQMTVCPIFFRDLSVHPALSQPQRKGFVVFHEAGHGSIDTDDIAYGHRRLIEFLALYPQLAVRNTDSYTLMVLCLNNFSSFCTPPAAADAAINMSDAEFRDARRGLGWLQSWLTWSSQDTSGAYSTLQDARNRGISPAAANGYYGVHVYPVLVREFDIHRPTGTSAPTLREQTTVAAILDRLRVMERATRSDGNDPFFITKDDMAGATMEWASGGPLSGPGRELTLTPVYFTLPTDRRRVETLLPLIIAATTSISAVMRPRYERFIIEDIRRSPSWRNEPR